MAHVAVSLAKSGGGGLIHTTSWGCQQLIYHAPAFVDTLNRACSYPWAAVCRQISKAVTFRGTGTFFPEKGPSDAAASWECFVAGSQAGGYCWKRMPSTGIRSLKASLNKRWALTSRSGPVERCLTSRSFTQSQRCTSAAIHPGTSEPGSCSGLASCLRVCRSAAQGARHRAGRRNPPGSAFLLLCSKLVVASPWSSTPQQGFPSERGCNTEIRPQAC